MAAALLLLPAVTWAETDDELAKSYFELGQELYTRSDYESAYKQFEKAYALSKRPALLFNMARCKEGLGQHAEAVRLFTQYLASNPPNADTIKARIANLNRLIEKKRAAQTEQAAAASGSASAEGAGHRPSEPEARSSTGSVSQDAAGAGSERTRRLAQMEDEARGQPRSRPLRLPGWILAGSGAALLITGAVLEGMAASKASEMEDANAAGREYAAVKDTGESGDSLETAGIVTLAVGGAAAVAGAVLIILDLTDQGTERRAWIAPSSTQGGALVTGGFTF